MPNPASLSFALRRRSMALSLLLIVLLFPGCGGGDTPAAPPTPPPPTPPPPVPTVGPPATVSIQAGDGQTADPGAPLATAPSVVVRDSVNRPVPNVAVRFAVDSGGGTITGAAAVTGTDGIATLAGWRLGPQEGPQVLSVTVGSLSPVRIRALARVATVTLPAKPLTGGAGTIVVSRPGLPLDGVTLTVNAGAFGAAGELAIGIASSADLVMPAGMRASSPALTLLPNGGSQEGPVLLSMPTSVALDTPLVVVARRADGGLAVLPTVRRTATTIDVSVPPAAALVFTNPSAPVRASSDAATSSSSVPAQNAQGAPFIFQLPIDPSLLAGGFDSGFRPETDGWPFASMIDAYGVRDAPGSALQRQSLDHAAAMSAIWYFRNQRTGGALRSRFMEAPGVLLSTRMGIRWNAWLESRMPASYRAFGLDHAQRTAAASDPAGTARNSFLALQSMFLLQHGAPQAVGLYEKDAAGGNVEFALGIAYRTTANAVDVAVPQSAEGGFRITLGPTGWQPAALRFGALSRPVTITGITAILVGGGFLDAVMASTWPQVADKTFGDALGWPAGVLMSKYGELDADDVVLLDPLQHWWECSACESTGWTQTPVQPHPTALVPFLWQSRRGDGTWSSTVSQNSSLRLSTTSFAPGESKRTAGFALLHPGPLAQVDNAIGEPAWIDWRIVNYRTLATRIAPADSVVASKDTSITFAVSAVNVPSGTLRYRWTVRAADGTGGDSVETSVPTWTKNFTLGTDRFVVSTILQGTGKRPIGRDSVRVKLDAAPWAAWRVSSFAVSVPRDDRAQQNPTQTGAIWDSYMSPPNNSSREIYETIREAWFADSARFARIESRADSVVVLYLHEPMDSPRSPGSAVVRRVPPGVFVLTEQQFAARQGNTIYGLVVDSLPLPSSMANYRLLETPEIATSDLSGPTWVTAPPQNCEADVARQFIVAQDPRTSGNVSGTRWRMFVRGLSGATETSSVVILDAMSLQAQGEVATGHWSKVYRILSTVCGSSNPRRTDMRVERRGTFGATRIR